MKKTIRLTESELINVIKNIISENKTEKTKVYTDKKLYEEKLKEYEVLYEEYKFSIKRYNFFKNLIIPIKIKNGDRDLDWIAKYFKQESNKNLGFTPYKSGSSGTPGTINKIKGSKVPVYNKKTKQKKLKIKFVYVVFYTCPKNWLNEKNYKPITVIQKYGGEPPVGTKLKIPNGTDSIFDLTILGRVFEKPTMPIYKELKSVVTPIITPPQKPEPRQEPKDIMMPDGKRISKEEFIKRYGQEVWDRYTKR